ncbi:trypsin-like peptidase domain-containing protein [Gordonia sp. ABSL11-1]|uniref:S1C family serine protease n=1 Tax=Gordonia sp. ABSL11-1 TaxID=3053924 RepID=UPI002574718B|nr:trypsin-like peptidase domain-containing protein [Gordonia sp. ABSL11-1]MDL9947600.1 trypsin-like peptidase domain-containing protein [Gordonia sp. ABSL11-1]
MNESQPTDGHPSPVTEPLHQQGPHLPPYQPWDNHAGAAYPPPAPARQRGGMTKPIIATALLAGLIGGAVGVGGSALLDRDSTPSVPVLNSQPADAANAADVKPGSVTYAAQVASKSAADIKVETPQGTAVGSGIVLSPDGYVLTNHHVVAAAGQGSTIQVTTSDGATHSAKVTGSSPSYDLAVIKLDGASGLTPAALGDSSSLQVGEQVVAVGSPENLSNTVTSGIVSALSRTVTAGDESGSGLTVYNGLQTDTPINPGNSGGPLVNLQGQVVGVNSAVDTGQAANGGPQAYGLGFAIPVNAAKRVANELLEDGKATKPVLGVSGSLASESKTTGAQITSVQADGAAADAGISSGDVITKIGNTPISNYADLMAQVLTHSPGETVPVTIGSGDGARTVQVKLGSTVDKEQTTIPESGDDGGRSGRGQSPFGGGSPFGLVP